MDSNPDRFLARHFRQSERASSPRSCSAEAVVRGGYEQARDEEAFRVFALRVMAAAERACDPVDVDIARHVYLGLSQQHVQVLRFTTPGEQRERVSARVVREGERPDDGGDVQSWTDWARLCRSVFGLERGHRVSQAMRRDARRRWRLVRNLVRGELQRREEVGREEVGRECVA